jgi:hypothetical protein
MWSICPAFVDYCRIADNISIKSNFLDRLERIGIERKHIRMTDIEKAIQFLNDRSYLSKNAPINYELTLTKKGLQHYENGLSFEQNYRDKYLVRQANTISFISIIIAVASLIASFIIN